MDGGIRTLHGHRLGVCDAAGGRAWARGVWRRPKCRRTVALPHLSLPAELQQSSPSKPSPAFGAYEVVYSRVVVRASASTRAAVVTTKVRGQLVVAEEVADGWVRVTQPDGWMLIDGTPLGLGPLLKPMDTEVAQGVPHELRLLASGDSIELRGGVRMPLLGMGTGGVPGLEGDLAIELVAHAIRHCGVRLIDTAADYHNEEQIGEAIRRSGVPRREIFVTTKLGPHSQGYESARASVLRSLQRMGLAYIDLVVIHWPGAWVAEQKEWRAADWMGGRAQALSRELRAGSWRALEDLVSQDRVLRCAGVSNYTPAQLLELLQTCRMPPSVLQSEHHPFYTNHAVRRLCAQRGIAFQASDRDDRINKPPASCARQPRSPAVHASRACQLPCRKAEATSQGFQDLTFTLALSLVRRPQAYGPLSGGAAERAAGKRGVDNPVVRSIAASVGRTPAQVLLRWAIQKGVAVLPKSTRRAGVEENAAAVGFELGEAMMRTLDGLDTGKPSYWDPSCVDVRAVTELMLKPARARTTAMHTHPQHSRHAPSYHDACAQYALVAQTLDSFNIFLDKERLQRELAGR